MLVEAVRRVLTLGMTFGVVDDVVELADQAVATLGDTSELRTLVRDIADRLEAEPPFGRARDLARVAHSVAEMGQQETVACLDILRAFARLAGTGPGETADPTTEIPLHDAFAALHIAPAGGLPARSRDLESIVISAAQAIGAQYGSLFLVDQASQELVFEVSLRERLEQLRRFRLPLGRGIAGLVAVTGQPIAVSDVADDPRHAADIAEQTGYTPKNMLCVPLQSGERIVGVLELLDKHGDTAFNLADMEALGAFASQAAETIEQSNLHEAVVHLLVVELRRLAAHVQNQTLREPDGDESLNGDHRQALEIAGHIRDIAAGDPEVASACGSVLRTLLDYARAQASNSTGFAR